MRTLQAGFTLVELIIVMVIMVILTTLGVVGLSTLQAQGRDSERASDIAIIARGLEQRYNDGNSEVTGYETRGSYPGANEFIHIMGWNWCGGAFASDVKDCYVSGGYYGQALPGVTTNAITAPNVSGQGLISTWFLSAQDIQDKLNAGFYIYQPLFADGTTTCYDSPCPSYILMYKQETTGNIVTVKSKHQ